MSAALINGLLHIFLIPPWQHYDEPGQFEYAWLIANKPGLPEPGEYIQSMRREVAASMIEHDFFINMGFRPNLLSLTEPVWIGISQTDDQPIYYALVAVPLYFLQTSDITFQLYVARLVSLLFFLVTVFASFGIISELTQSGSPFRLLVPITIALLPGFADMMTAVNNDVGAVASFTLFLWVGVHILRRGFTWLSMLAIIFFAVTCLFTKNTTLFVIPLTILVLVLSLLPQSKRILGWAALTLLAGILIVLSLSYDGIAYWHDLTQNNSLARSRTDLTPLGEYALQMDSPTSGMSSFAAQLIPKDHSEELSGNLVSLGAWIWASTPSEMRSPTVDDGITSCYEVISVGQMPQFFDLTCEINENASQVIVKLPVLPQFEANRISVFFDGIILVDGDHTSEENPEVMDAEGKSIKWGSEIFSNYIRNASFELKALRIKPEADSMIKSYIPLKISNLLSSVVDLQGFRSYYTASAQHLFRSFWAVFGWGQVYLIGSKPYRILLIISLIAVIGDVIYLLRNQQKLPWHILGFLGIALLGVWGMAAIRGVSTVFSNVFIPAARYAYPVIVPTVMLFVVGWLEILIIIGERLKISQLFQYAVYISFLLLLNGLSIYSIWLYYDTF
jgi:hypothetical protein